MNEAIQILETKLTEYRELKSKATNRRAAAQEALALAQQEVQLYAAGEAGLEEALAGLRLLATQKRKDREKQAEEDEKVPK